MEDLLDQQIAIGIEGDVIRLRGLPDDRITDVGNIGQSAVAAFDPAGQRLVVAQESGPMLIVDARTGKESRRLEGQIGVGRVEFNNDGTQLAAVGQDGATWIWDTDAGERIQVLRGLDSTAVLTFSPDGGQIMVGGGHSVRVFDPVTGQELMKFESKGAACCGVLGDQLITATSYSADGTRILIFHSDGIIKVHNAFRSDIAVLCAKLTTNMSVADWTTNISSRVGYPRQCEGLPEPAGTGQIVPGS
ncbi:WD40 repeat domain-containing protein [Nocardia sp. NPDC056541]|uniref:WD40 repeat domain-containing protein n=1 Tax=Nocardia sp. NPDC056541 TaxID=3345860 RepID=UPI003672D30C